MDGGQGLQKLEENLKSRDELVRLVAVEKLGEIASSDAARLLVAVLENDPSRLVKEAAAISLTRIGSSFVCEEVAPLLKSDDPYLRNVASEILQLIGDPGREVVELLLHDPDPDVRMLAIRVLGEGSFCCSAELLRDLLLQEDNVNVAATAVEYMGDVGGAEEDIEAVKSVLRRFSDPFLQFAVDLALLKMGGER